MTKIAKPKPCPFCKGTKVHMERQAMDYFCDICEDCGARGPAIIQEWDDDDDKDAARTRRAWNARSREAVKKTEAYISD